MRSDILKFWLDTTSELPVDGTNEWEDLTNEDRLVINQIRAAFGGNASSFNAIMAQRYGQLKAGDGEEITGSEGTFFDAGFNLEDE